MQRVLHVCNVKQGADFMLFAEAWEKCCINATAIALDLIMWCW
jgi:hypothetical protein